LPENIIEKSVKGIDELDCFSIRAFTLLILPKEIIFSEGR
jgi:hypothetical protein